MARARQQLSGAAAVSARAPRRRGGPREIVFSRGMPHDEVVRPELSAETRRVALWQFMDQLGEGPLTHSFTLPFSMTGRPGGETHGQRMVVPYQVLSTVATTSPSFDSVTATIALP